MPDSALIIENGLVVTCDPHRRAGPMALLIRGGRIAEIASRADSLRTRYPFAETLNAAAKVIVPGFVDAHYHGESFVLRHWTTDVPYGEWLRHPKTKHVLSHVHGELSTDRLAVFYRLAYFAALRAGITFINEFGINNLDLPFLAALEGFRRSDLQGMIAVHNGDQYDRARSSSSKDVRFTIALPIEEDLTTYNMQTALRTARELQWDIAVHAGEARHGLEVFRRNFQGSLVHVLQDFRFLDNKIQLIHFSQVDEADAAVLTQAGVSVICCPLAALAKQSIVPPLQVLLSAGVPLALGSDWGSPDPFSTMRGMLSLARSQGIRTLMALDLLSMHTINAARALGLDSERGSIEVGKRADLTFIDVSDFRFSYIDDPIALESTLMSLLLDAGSASVTDVMVGGEFFLRGGHTMTYAEEDLRREGSDLMRSLYRVAGEPLGEASPPEGSATPVYPLPTHEVAPADRQASLEGKDEGFRVIRKADSKRPDGRAPHEAPQPPPKSNPPPQPRREFGDDDL